MKYKSFTLLVVILLCFVTKSFSQRGNYRITNGIGVFGGITNFDIATDNFITNQGNGFLGGFSATVDIPFKWYNISYDIQLSENNVGILSRPNIVSTTNEFVDYKVFAAQIALLAHIKVIETYLAIDVGPMLQYNGKMELKDKSKEGYYINNYANLTATDISNISQFNFDGAIGASAGFKNFKLKAQYIYGFTNILKKLEKQDIDTTGGDSRFKGNQNMLVLGAMILF